MQSAAERQALNHYLKKHGLGALDDRGLPAQLAFLIDDDAEFSRLLNICEPAERRSMYESLKPNLRFKARPFDEYLAEWREQAEVRQLPVVQPDGTMRAYNVPEIDTERMQKSIEASIAESVARYHLILSCRRCTFQEAFPGVNKPEALERARAAGWVHCHGEGSTGFEICPTCVSDKAYLVWRIRHPEETVRECDEAAVDPREGLRFFHQKRREMGLRDDWNNPNELDAFKGLMACHDDNSYYAAVKGFAVYVSDVQRRFESLFETPPLRVQNLTQSTADMYNSTGCYGAEAGPQCVLDNLAGKPLNPNLTQFQIYCLNNCADPDTVQSGQWEQAGDAIRQSYRDLWQKFQELYPPS